MRFTYLPKILAVTFSLSIPSALAGGAPPNAGGGWVKVEKHMWNGKRSIDRMNLAWSESSIFGRGVEGAAKRL